MEVPRVSFVGGALWVACIYCGLCCDAETVEVVLRNTTSSSAEFQFQPLSGYPDAAPSPVVQRIQAKGQSKPNLLLPKAPSYQLRRSVTDGGQRVFTIDLMAYIQRAQDANGDRGVVPVDYRELVRRETEQRVRSVPVTRYRPEERTREYAVTTFVPETKTRTVNVTQYRPESRTRTVRRYSPTLRRYVDEVEEYTVRVPYTESVEQSYTVNVPVQEMKTSTYTVQVPYTEAVEQVYSVNVDRAEVVIGSPGLPDLCLSRDWVAACGDCADTGRKYLGIELVESNGALVTRTIPGAPATRLHPAGSEPGQPTTNLYSLRPNYDWILMVNEESVISKEEADWAIQSSDTKCRLLVRHGAKGIAEWYDVDLDVEGSN